MSPPAMTAAAAPGAPVLESSAATRSSIQATRGPAAVTTWPRSRPLVLTGHRAHLWYGDQPEPKRPLAGAPARGDGASAARALRPAEAAPRGAGPQRGIVAGRAAARPPPPAG